MMPSMYDRLKRLLPRMGPTFHTDELIKVMCITDRIVTDDQENFLRGTIGSVLSNHRKIAIPVAGAYKFKNLLYNGARNERK